MHTNLELHLVCAAKGHNDLVERQFIFLPTAISELPRLKKNQTNNNKTTQTTKQINKTTHTEKNQTTAAPQNKLKKTPNKCVQHLKVKLTKMLQCNSGLIL